MARSSPFGDCQDRGFSVRVKQQEPLKSNSLSSSRAYELISIANGEKTIEDFRERSAESMRQSRAQAKEAAVRNVAETSKSFANQPLTENNPGNPPVKSKGGRPHFAGILFCSN